jgi:hypothetical protein
MLDGSWSGMPIRSEPNGKLLGRLFEILLGSIDPINGHDPRRIRDNK